MRLPFFAIAMFLTACQSPGTGNASASSSVTVPGDHALRAGQSLSLPDDSTLTYVRLVADSRCRPDVQCIRAGDADIELRWNPASGSAVNATLNSDPGNQQQAPNQANFGGWQVALKSLDWKQPPTATVTISRAN